MDIISVPPVQNASPDYRQHITFVQVLAECTMPIELHRALLKLAVDWQVPIPDMPLGLIDNKTLTGILAQHLCRQEVQQLADLVVGQ